MWRQLVTTTTALGLLSLGAFAQQDDGPGRGVARVSVINGEVSVKRGDSGDIITAAANAPLVVQDRIFTGSGSRAEVQFDYSNMLRMAANAEVRFAELEFKRYIVQIARGTVTFRVLRDQEADVEVSTPNISVRPVKRGIYRVTVLEDGTSEVTVRSGEAEIYTPRGTERLKSGKTMLARGTAADPEFRTVAEIGDDEWDRWNSLRDRDLERSRSYSYVSRDIYGAEDLDGHGRWVSTPDYGTVWMPTVAPGWAPYRNGRWSWVDWYGWTWVSYDPWGWAPYHYGRWYWNTGYNNWCWYPGGLGVRHYWSPALVAFVGFGRGGVNFGFGNIGWIPLGPREPFYPWYGNRYYSGYNRGYGYGGNNVRIVNNVNITNVYRNARVANGITGIDHEGFGRGRSGTAFSYNEASFRGSGVMQGQLPVAPGRESLRLADREARAPQSGVRDNATFYSHRTPAQVERVPFETQRRGFEQASARGFAEAGGRGGVAAAAADVGAVSGRGGADGSSRGWRQAGETAAQPAATGGGRSAADSGGWRTFGSPRSGTANGSPAVAAAPQTGEGGRGNVAAPPSSDSGRSGRSADGWTRFGSGRNEAGPSQSGATPSAVPSAESGRGGRSADGWTRFGSARSEAGASQAGATPSAAPPSTDSGRSGRSADGSTRFGSVRSEAGTSPSGATPSAAPSAPENGRSGRSADGWTRFGSTRSDSPASDTMGRGSSRSSDANSYSRGADSHRIGSGASPQSSPAPAAREFNSRSTSESAPRVDGGRGARSDSSPRSGGGDSVRISPSIVHERGQGGGAAAAPRGDSGGGGNRGAGGNSGRAEGGGGHGGRTR